ncbi:hypothetical protein GWI33_010564 [Rhynchophorus ferrugineus]|uniref:Uncharacterized protein n=1 Tax=Rhynchophorus ferrugineus TaxID=354439 RepID=A0A834ILP7_RHYFE|nr:hypothetical protein GWI33_010564 [Rhynchophorus ferrugineus]
MVSGNPSKDPPNRPSLSYMSEEFLKTCLSMSVYFVESVDSAFAWSKIHARFLYCTQSRTKVEDWLISLDEEDLNILEFDVTSPEVYFQKFKNEITDIWLFQLYKHRKTVTSSTEAFEQFIRELEYSQPDPVSQVEDKREEEIKNKKEMKEIVPRVRRVRSCFF